VLYLPGNVLRQFFLSDREGNFVEILGRNSSREALIARPLEIGASASVDSYVEIAERVLTSIRIEMDGGNSAGKANSSRPRKRLVDSREASSRVMPFSVGPSEIK